LRRSGRLSDLCRAAGIPSLRLCDVNATQAQARLRAARPDVILSFHFDQIFTAETLAIAPLGGVNVHPSLLPRHRGPIPTLYALAEGATGVSIHAMVPCVDAGGVLTQRAVPLPPGLSVGGAARALHLAALPLLEEALALLPANPEPAPLLPYCPFPDRPTLARLRAQGVRLVTADDGKASLFAPAGGWR
jgi:methionyl-tRNA formyltransferase